MGAEVNVVVKDGKLTKEQMEHLWIVFSYVENCFQNGENLDPEVLQSLKKQYPLATDSLFINPNQGMNSVDQSSHRIKPFLAYSQLIDDPSEMKDSNKQATMSYQIAVLLGNFKLAESLLDNKAFEVRNFRNPCLEITAVLGSDKLLDAFLKKYPSSDKISKDDAKHYFQPAVKAARNYGAEDNAKAITEFAGKELLDSSLDSDQNTAR